MVYRCVSKDTNQIDWGANAGDYVLRILNVHKTPAGWIEVQTNRIGARAYRAGRILDASDSTDLDSEHTFIIRRSTILELACGAAYDTPPAIDFFAITA
jgi:hypothetical protein